MIRTRILSVALMIVSSASAMAEDRPLALVEHVTASGAQVSAYDYVYEDDKIDLRPDGQLRIAYFDSCIVETFTGGVIKLKEDKTKISKGGVSNRETRPCQTAALALSETAKEAAAAVKRVSPFAEEEWREISIAVATPRFIWPDETSAENTASVSIYFLEADPVKHVWQGEATENFLIYPEEAPALETGMPYLVVVSYDGKEARSAVFSVDPDLDMPEDALTTAVPLGL